TNAQGRVHGVEGLIVADGSVMPSAGAVNPGSTIGALALKFADDLAQEIGRRKISLWWRQWTLSSQEACSPMAPLRLRRAALPSRGMRSKSRIGGRSRRLPHRQ